MLLVVLSMTLNNPQFNHAIRFIRGMSQKQLKIRDRHGYTAILIGTYTRPTELRGVSHFE